MTIDSVEGVRPAQRRYLTRPHLRLCGGGEAGTAEVPHPPPPQTLWRGGGTSPAPTSDSVEGVRPAQRRYLTRLPLRLCGGGEAGTAEVPHPPPPQTLWGASSHKQTLLR
uniref:Uncharacterized protein n=1 Tax=Knipowitschia caucasica TaxID=637954 RepID=A0AAV2M3C8_KNICA